jgi:hypothetical protein
MLQIRTGLGHFSMVVCLYIKNFLTVSTERLMKLFDQA